MKNHWRLLGAALALPLTLVLACSTTEVVTQPPLPDSGTEASFGTPRGLDDERRQKADAGRPPQEGGVALICPQDAINAASFPWKPPARVPGACTEEDLAAFVAFVASTTDPQKWKDGPWTTNEGCRSCVFGRATDVWPPLILNAAGQLSELNVGGCIAVVSGSDDCGRTYQQFRTCAQIACRPPCEPPDYSDCSRIASRKICKKGFDDMVQACGGFLALKQAEEACEFERYAFEGSIRAQCIGLEGGL